MVPTRALLSVLVLLLALLHCNKICVEAAMVKKKKKKPRALPVAEVQPWTKRWCYACALLDPSSHVNAMPTFSFSRNHGNGPPPLSPGTNCLAILNVRTLDDDTRDVIDVIILRLFLSIFPS